MDSDERHKINDGWQRLLVRGDPARLIAFVCECGDRDCHRTVPLSVTEYEARRPDRSSPAATRRQARRSR